MSIDAPWAEPTRDGLARFLGELWGVPVTVVLEGVASAGARRRNVLFRAMRADGGGTAERLVATIVPTAAMQIQDFLVEPGAIALAESRGVPVAHLVGANEDPSYTGGSFFVTARVDGETVPRRVLRLVEAEGIGTAITEQCGRALAALHAAPLASAPPGLVAEGTDPIETAVARVDASLSELLQPSPVFSLVLRWLDRHRPAATAPTVICHGDFRTGNLIVGRDGLRAVLDWEAVRLGDPMEDLAWATLRMWRFGNDTGEVGGFGGVEQLAAAYAAAGGTWDEERFGWWQVYGPLRWGIGLAHQAKAHLDGSVPSVVMAASGRRVAEQEYDTLSELRRRGLGA